MSNRRPSSTGCRNTPSYRALRQYRQPHALQRADAGIPRVLPKAELERYCELIAAIKSLLPSLTV